MSESIYPQRPLSIIIEPLVTTFTLDPPVAENGDTVDSVVVSLGYDQTPLSVVFNGVAISPFTERLTVAGPFTEDESWTVKMTVQNGSASAKATLEFKDRMFWGNVNAAPTDSAGILALETSKFADTYAGTFQMGSPNGDMPCFAYPASFATPRKVEIGVPTPRMQQDSSDWSILTGFTTSTVAFTNNFGYTEDYIVVVFDSPRSDSSLLVRLT